MRRFLIGLVTLLLAGLFMVGCNQLAGGGETGEESETPQKTSRPATVAAADLKDYVARFVKPEVKNGIELQRLKAGRECYYVRKYDYDRQIYNIAKVSVIDDREELVISANGEGVENEKRSVLCFDGLEDGRLVVLLEIYAQKEEDEFSELTGFEIAEYDESGRQTMSIPCRSSSPATASCARAARSAAMPAEKPSSAFF